jgi:DNA-binding beta-propeller fold protein YncE
MESPAPFAMGYLGCLLLLSLASPLYGNGARLFKSGPIQITAEGAFVWTANQDNDSVTRIATSDDAATEFLLPDPATKDSPRGLFVMEDGSEVWVACHDSDRLYVLSGADGSVLGRVDLPWGSGPYSVALSRHQNVALVTLYRAAALAVVDVPSRRLTHILQPVYWSPPGVAWTEDGLSAIVTHLFAEVILTAVHIHDPSGSNPYLGPGWDARVAGPIDIGFSSDGAQTYLLHELSDDLVVMPSNTPLVKPEGASPLPQIPVGRRPMGLAVSPVADVAYVYNLLSRDVSAVDLDGWTELKRIGVTPLTGETFAPEVLAGAKIFHTSDDLRVSQNNKVACASCHINAEHDGRTWAFHRLPGLHGPRAVPSLLGLGRTFGPRDPVTGLGQLHRSGDRDEVQDFEHTFQSLNMGGTGFLGASVNPELGAPNGGRRADLDALASSTWDQTRPRSASTEPASPDRRLGTGRPGSFW